MPRPTINTTTTRLVNGTHPYPSIYSTHDTSPDYDGRLRTASSASTSSSMSITSPIPSSNASTSSLNIPSTSQHASDGEPSTSPGEAQSPLDPYDEEYGLRDLPEEWVLAMHDFEPQEPNPTCLSFRAGQVLRVLNRDPSGWWDGEVDGRRGWFPSNYVHKEVSLLTSEEPQTSHHPKKGHLHTASQSSLTSVASWTSTQSLHQKHTTPRSRPRESAESDVTITMPDDPRYCPEILTPLLSSVRLLQGTVRARRRDHFQPSVAFILGCVRGVLMTTGCLNRESPFLQKNDRLAYERKSLLQDLASLVSQARAAGNEEAGESEEELMLEYAGRIFVRVRNFVSLAVQSGVEIAPEDVLPGTIAKEPKLLDANANDVLRAKPKQAATRADTQQTRKLINGNLTRRARQQDPNVIPGLVARARSMGNLRQSRPLQTVDGEYAPHTGTSRPPMPDFTEHSSQNKPEEPLRSRSQMSSIRHGNGHGHRAMNSYSSFSSSSSISSVGSPVLNAFPTGPCKSKQVLSALRDIHDQHLSTIAAFIGHLHSHSRSAHASSTGHLFDLVGQIIDFVCKILTIADAVIRHPDIPPGKVAALRDSKESLYRKTNALASAVRQLTNNGFHELSEDEEMNGLLRTATEGLKAGSDTVSGIKLCLGRSMGDEPLVFVLPIPSDSLSTPLRSRDSRGSNITVLPGSPHMEPVEEQSEPQLLTPIDHDDEDHTMRPRRQPAQEVSQTLATSSSEGTDYTSTSSATDVDVADVMEVQPPKVLKPQKSAFHIGIQIPRGSLDLPLPSPTSLAPTEGATTWEGSQRSHTLSALEEKLANGELPSIPSNNGEFLESTALAWAMTHDYAPSDVAYNSDGHLVGATMGALVEKMTPHDSMVDNAFAAIFFLTFRLFSSPMELFEALVSRYNLEPPAGLSIVEISEWQKMKMLPVRLRISNFLKLWLEHYWRRDTDSIILGPLMDFVTNILSESYLAAAQRIEILIRVRMAESDAPLSVDSQWAKSGDRPSPSQKFHRAQDILLSEIPRPIMTKSVLSALRNKAFETILVTDFDALELARQLTMMESTLYCAVTTEEVLEMGQSGAAPAVNVRAVSSLSTVITGWVAESILNEKDGKRRPSLVKFFIKVADRCTGLKNFSTSRAILAALDSSTIARLRQTWANVPQKNKVQLESLRKLADHARNYHEYRSRLRNTSPPAVPFLGLYLTDLTFCREGNSSFRASPLAPEKKLLNFNKFHKLARIVQDLQRFQVPYNLKEIPEVQDYLRYSFEKSKRSGDLEDLYRRSLLVEPKAEKDIVTPSSDLKQLFSFGLRQNQAPAAA